jgi:hypothetical protein
VDTDDVEPTRAYVLELVRRFWAYDRDVAGARLDVFAVRSDPRPSTADDPGLGIGMPVQVRPSPGSLLTRKNETPEPWGSPSNVTVPPGLRCCSPAGMTWYMSLLSVLSVVGVDLKLEVGLTEVNRGGRDIYLFDAPRGH